MAQRSFQKSFIPKKKLSTAARRTGGRSDIDVPTVVGSIICLGTLAVALGMFLYSQYLQQSIQTKRESLAAEAAKINPETRRDLETLHQRLRAAESILDNHIAPSRLFGLLERATLRDLEFATLKLTAGSSKSVQFKATGRADDFGTIALQVDTLRGDRGLQEALVGELTVQRDRRAREDGTEGIEFAINGTVKPELVSYAETVSSRQARFESRGATSTARGSARSTGVGTTSRDIPSGGGTVSGGPAGGSSSEAGAASGDSESDQGWWEAITSYIGSWF